MFRRGRAPGPGRGPGISRGAADRDRIIQDLFFRQGKPMVAFVTAIAEAFSPLFALKGGPGKAHLVRRTWQPCAPRGPP